MGSGKVMSDEPENRGQKSEVRGQRAEIQESDFPFLIFHFSFFI
jgi:hypothetical protein